MCKFTLWVLTLMLIQNTRSQRYYYAQFGDQYDIYYGPRAIENYKEVRTPKSYKIEYGQRADRPGVCYEANFSCTNRKYPVSKTLEFECLEDFQCPRYYKCCQPICFQHKVCQPAIISSSTEETTQSGDNDKFGGGKFSTQNKPEITTIKYTKSSTLNKDELFDEWLKQNSNFFTATSFHVETQSSTVEYAKNLFQEPSSTTLSHNIDRHSSSTKDIQKALEEWLKQIPHVHSTTPLNADVSTGKQINSVQNTEKFFNTPDRLSSKTRNIFHTSETQLTQTTPISLAVKTTQNNIDKNVLITSDDENILEEIEGSGDYPDQKEDKEGTNNVNQIINEIFKNSTEIPVEDHARKTNKIPKESEYFLSTKVEEMQTETNDENKKTTTIQMYSTSAREKIKELEDENKRNTTVQILITDVNYTTNKINKNYTKRPTKDHTKESKNKHENITEKIPKEDEDLFFTYMPNHIPDKKFTENMAEFLKTTDDENILEEMEGSGGYLGQIEGKESTNNVSQIINEKLKNSTEIPVEEHTRKTNKIPKESEDFLFTKVEEMQTETNNENIKNYTKMPDEEFKKETSKQDTLQENEDVFFTNTQHYFPDKNTRNPEEILKTTDNKNIFEEVESNSNNNEHKEDERKTNTDYTISTNFKHYTKKPVEEHKRATTQNMVDILKTTNDENLLEEIEGSGNYDYVKESKRRTTVQVKSADKNTIVQETFKSYTEKPTKNWTTETDTEKIKNVSNNPSKENEDLFFTNMPSDVTEENFTRNIEEILKTTDDENILEFTEGSGDYDDHDNDKLKTSVQMDSSDIDQIIDNIFKNFTLEEPIQTQTKRSGKEKETTESLKPKNNTNTEFMFENDRYTTPVFLSVNTPVTFLDTDSSKHTEVNNVTLKHTVTSKTDYSKFTVTVSNLNTSTEGDKKELSTQQITASSKYATTATLSSASNTTEIETNLNQNTNLYLTTPPNVNVTIDRQKNAEELFEEWLKQNVNLYYTTPFSIDAATDQQTGSAQDFQESFKEWLKHNLGLYLTSNSQERSKSTTKEIFTNNQDGDYKELLNDWLKENQDIYWTTLSNVHTTANKQISSSENFQEQYKKWLKQNPNLYLFTSPSLTTDKYTYNIINIQKVFEEWSKENLNSSPITPLNTDVTINEQTNNVDNYRKFEEWLKENPDLYLSTPPSFTRDKYYYNTMITQKIFKEWSKENLNFHLTTPLNTDVPINEQTNNIGNHQKFEEWLKENEDLYLTTGSSLNSQEGEISDELEQYLTINSYTTERESTLSLSQIAYKEKSLNDIAKNTLDENQEKYNEHEDFKTKNNITNSILNTPFNTSHDINLETSVESTNLGNYEGEVAACHGESSTIPKPKNESSNKNIDLENKESSETTYKKSQSTDKEWNERYDEIVKNAIKNIQTLVDDEDSVQEASGGSSGDYEIVNNKELE